MVENSQEYRLKYWATRSSVRSFARSLAPLTCSLAPDCSLRSRPPLRSLICSLAHFAHFLACGTVNGWMAILSVFFSIFDHSALLSCIPSTLSPSGHVTTSLKVLIQDFRKIMEPYTASSLRASEKNSLKARHGCADASSMARSGLFISAFGCLRMTTSFNRSEWTWEFWSLKTRVIE